MSQAHVYDYQFCDLYGEYGTMMARDHLALMFFGHDFQVSN